MKIISFKLSEITCDPKNARKHSIKNIESIKNSLKFFGQQKPIVIGKQNTIIAGNGTYEAAKQLGWKYIDAVISELEGQDAKAFAIADNRTAELAEWDLDILEETLREVDEDFEVEYGLEDLGFDRLEDINFEPNLPDENSEENPTEGKKILIVECKTMEDLENIFHELLERGFKVKADV